MNSDVAIDNRHFTVVNCCVLCRNFTEASFNYILR